MYHRLEAGHTVTLVNPQHLKAVPGHQTDVKDSEWLADLLRHGLLKASSRPAQGLLHSPAAPPRAARADALAHDPGPGTGASGESGAQSAGERQHQANIKLAAVASAVVGARARRMLEALVGGQADVEAMAPLAPARLRAGGGAFRSCARRA